VHPFRDLTTVRRFSFKSPSITPVEMSNTPRRYFGPLEDYQCGECSIDSKENLGENFSRGFFAFGIIWVVMG